jgi:CheY-like chemotaxis protein
MNNYDPCWKNTSYYPSILLVTDDCQQVLNFKQWLEAEGCQVYRANLNDLNEIRDACRHILFDLILLSLQTAEVSQTEGMNPSLRSLYKNLQSAPALLTLPLVVLNPCQSLETTLDKLGVGPVYHILQNAALKVSLLQTIEQIYYLTYRYG